MFFYGRIVVPFHSLSSKSRNSKLFTHSGFKMALNFAIIGSIAATAFKFISILPELKKTGILSLNVKILINLHLVWNTVQKLQWGSLFFSEVTWVTIFTKIFTKKITKSEHKLKHPNNSDIIKPVL